MAEKRSDIGSILEDDQRIDRALGRAVRDALRRHKALGNPVATWRDRKVVWIAPEEIVIKEEETDA